ncbi:MAG: hypothetical protein A3C79_01200 [Candidatus Taylorbacteria bacterium RIFCSPHIGHO2_02_FULL_45_28]|uniref:Transmembrane protein n=1 Tax=Candidatus Taylorbacteria bacterium RIFCSPHIGHO2_12_FULL_45_16 TaxID=1802315 RepID=A0A1G2MZP8_9BACT|nr:MAG: hypothetical protein A2830_02455 [Candidatus Taylorbacteria bacterium RIFCSPHIGHO2_01_FULL_44_110]OHA25632.1 MAG: hypothetical protein A3C79_01200 [Candidatus Taylorbacteria bacterium RIFCSPHIGHO2_02_FULL_45_28]OHA29298.1 MAG: hypothetical protein A3F51_01665 [Candidatus Taylorbacteria bacterium RIFCSPHIGHO2_12_FULL_45_16]OHA33520.1 MAG: hypothetical protein A3A23_02545 [Candidatus Taylorbacteria bacterium RIFCSPLOWO2_01_FULL_45_59]OHA39144.1 MAG: hypothetical protein A3I98_00895 [Candi
MNRKQPIEKKDENMNDDRLTSVYENGGLDEEVDDHISILESLNLLGWIVGVILAICIPITCTGYVWLCTYHLKWTLIAGAALATIGLLSIIAWASRSADSIKTTNLVLCCWLALVINITSWPFLAGCIALATTPWAFKTTMFIFVGTVLLIVFYVYQKSIKNRVADIFNTVLVALSGGD